MKIFKLKKLNIASKKIIEVPFPSTDLFRWMERKGINPEENVLIVEHEPRGEFKSREEREEARKVAKKNLAAALVAGILLAKQFLFKKTMAGSSQLRNAMSTWMPEDIKKEFVSWWSCDIDTGINAVANKYLVYLTLSMSSSTPWEEATTLDPIDINKVAVVKDGEVEIELPFDSVENYGIKRNVIKVKNKFTDGLAVLVVDGEVPDSELKGFTTRASGVKGLTYIVRRKDAVAACEALGLGYEFQDVWGNKFDIRTVQLIMHTSVYKWTKSTKNWSTYVEGFKKGGHAFSICVKDHDAISDMPYQQFQTLMAGEKDTDALADRSIEMLSRYEDKNMAPYLLTKTMAAAARLYPALMKEEYASEQMQNTYASRRQRIAGGRIPAVTHYRFAAPHPHQVLLNIFGRKPDHNGIPAKHVVCNAQTVGAVVDVTRSPHLDNAHLLRKVIRGNALHTGNTMYFSVWDASMNALQMDFDGDHVCVSENKTIVRLAQESIKELGNIPLYYEAQGAKPGVVTDKEINELLLNIESAPVGLYANTITKCWALIPKMPDELKKDNSELSPEQLQQKKKIEARRGNLLREISYLTRACNLCIDRAKYGKNAVLTPADKEGDRIMRMYRKVKKPMFLSYAKTSAMCPEELAEFASNCQPYDSCVERYSRRVLEHTCEVLCVDDLEDLTFDWHMLTRGQAAREAVSGLVTGGGSDAGLFNRLAYRRAREWSDVIQASDNAAVRSEFRRMSDEQIRKEVFVWATDHGFDFQTVLDSMIMAIYVQNPERSKQLKRTLWDCFGEEIVENIRENVRKGIRPGAVDEMEPEVEMEPEGMVYADEEELDPMLYDGAYYE